MKDYYRVAFDAFQKDAERYWTVFNLMSIINGGLFIFVLNAKATLIIGGVAGFGLALCIIWALVQRRYQYWVNQRQDVLKKLEELYIKEIKLTDAESLKQEIAPIYGKNPLEQNSNTVFKCWKAGFWNWKNLKQISRCLRDHGISTRNAGWIVPCLFLLAWFAVLVTASRLEALSRPQPMQQPDAGVKSNGVLRFVITNFVIVTNVFPSPPFLLVQPPVTNYLVVSNLLLLPSGTSSIQQILVPKGSTNP